MQLLLAGDARANVVTDADGDARCAARPLGLKVLTLILLLAGGDGGCVDVAHLGCNNKADRSLRYELVCHGQLPGGGV
jgi:hypothetical protein